MTGKSNASAKRAGRDIVEINLTGNNNALATHGGTATISISQAAPDEWKAWRTRMEREIKALKNLTTEEKSDLTQNVAQVVQEAAKGEAARPGVIEGLLNTLSAMAPDILDVIIATIANPLAGLGLVAKKIGEKAVVSRKVWSMPAKRKGATDRPAMQPTTKINVRGSDDAIAVGEKSFAANIKLIFQGNWKPFTAVLFLVAVLLGAILYYVIPRQTCCFTVKFGVAVAAFGVEDQNGKISRTQDSDGLSATIASVLRTNLAESLKGVETNDVWGPDRTGLILSEAEANKFALARNASIVIYGRIKQVNGINLISPQFYVNPAKFQDADEITGQHELGSDVQVRLNAAMPLTESPGVEARVNGMSMLTIGLVYYSIDQFDQALTYFRKADNPKWAGSGKDSLYLLTGNVIIRQASQTKKFTGLAEAEQYYLESLKISNNTYARAMVGMANVMYLQATTQGSCNPAGLDAASVWLNDAFDHILNPDSANIETKVHFYRGQIALIRYSCKLPGEDWAALAEQEFSKVIQRYEANPNSAEGLGIREYASAAYARLGYLAYYWKSDAQATIDFLNKAIPLASPAPKADYEEMLGDVYVVVGQKDQARTAYQLAQALANSSGDQAKIDKIQQKLEALSGP